MGTFTVYGYFYGSDELPEVVAYAKTYEDAHQAMVAYQMDSESLVEYDLYAIEHTIGGVSFAAFA
jgi:hypothetical protein